MTAVTRLVLGHNLAEVQLIISEHALAAFSNLGYISLRKQVQKHLSMRLSLKKLSAVILL